MQPYEDEQDEQLVTIYEDENYTIWIDNDEQIVNIFLEEKGLTLHLDYEEFDAFRKNIGRLTSVDIDKRTASVFLAERGLTLHFPYEDFLIFKALMESIETWPKWWMCWN